MTKHRPLYQTERKTLSKLYDQLEKKKDVIVQIQREIQRWLILLNRHKRVLIVQTAKLNSLKKRAKEMLVDYSE